MSDEKPPEKPTVKFVPPTDRELLEKLIADSAETRLTVVRSAQTQEMVMLDVKTLKSDFRGLSAKVSTIEEWKDGIESGVIPRLATHSMNVQKLAEVQQQTSNHDMEQDGKIADALMKATMFSAEIEGIKKDMTEAVGQVTSLRSTLDEVVKKVDTVHSTVVGFFKNPRVIFVGKVIFFIAVTYSGLHGLKVVP